MPEQQRDINKCGKIVTNVVQCSSTMKKNTSVPHANTTTRKSGKSVLKPVPQQFRCMTKDLCHFKQGFGSATGSRCKAHWQVMKTCRYILKNWRKLDANNTI